MKNELEKYTILVSLVDWNLLEEKAANIVRHRPVTKPGHSTPYNLLKQAILESIINIDQKIRVQTLLDKEKLGDSKPSEFLTRLKRIADPNSSGNPELVAAAKKAWLAALPAEWTNALGDIADLTEASMKADVFSTWQKNPASAHLYEAAVGPARPPSPDEHDIETRMARLEEMVSQMSVRLRDVDRTPPPSTSTTNGHSAQDLSSSINKFATKLQLPW